MNIKDIDFGEKRLFNISIHLDVDDLNTIKNGISGFYVERNHLHLEYKINSKTGVKETRSIEYVPQNISEEKNIEYLNKNKSKIFLSVLNVNSIDEKTSFWNILLQANIFSENILYPDKNNPFVISLSSKYTLEVRKTSHKSIDNICKFMEREFLLNERYLFLQPVEDTERIGILLGKSYTCDLIYDPSQSIVYAAQLKPKHNNQIRKIQHIQVLEGNLKFQDGNERLKIAARKIFEGESEENKQFERIWNAYNEAQEEEAAEETDKVGAVEYQSIHHTEPLWLQLTRDLDTYRDKDFLESSLGYVVCEKKDFEEAKKHTSENGEVHASRILEYIKNKKKRPILLGDRIYWDSSSHRLIVPDAVRDEELPEQGYILASYLGMKTMTERRRRAYSNIQSLKNPMPMLRSIITSGTLTEETNQKHIKPLNKKLVQRIFGSTGNTFTERQREAIDIAINTPDIALIQGPPGTGKTTIIRAIVERLNENNPENLRILIASTQHDAVDNAISGMECSGMPPVRLGGKHGDELDSKRYLTNWILKLQGRCDALLENESDSHNKLIHRHIYSLISQLKRSDLTNIDKDKELLKDLSQCLIRINAPEEILNLIRNVYDNIIDIKHQDNSADDSVSDILLLLDQQSKTEKDFLENNGKRRLNKLITLMEINDIERPEKWDILRRVRANRIPDNFENIFHDFLQDIAKLYTKINKEKDVKSEIDILPILDEIKGYIDDLSTHTNTIYDILWDFRDKIAVPGNIERVLQKYAKVKAATCQQSVMRVQGLNGIGFTKLKENVYDYVIIDEAARSNPLDLLIPMSLGAHVILVGDQKQLPHMLEEDVTKRVLEKYEIKEERIQKEKLLKESLFQRLFRQLKEKHNSSRVTMLREQYRMHPVIGNFISDSFYDGKLVSPIPAEKKAHNLEIFDNKPIAWIDIPISNGGEERSSYSYTRSSEAKKVLSLIDNIKKRNSAYSIGVITFYKAQAQKIRTLLHELPETTYGDIGVGTVDAFQGKEFDVVILSTVRSNTIKDKRKRVGFLDNPNRLCVAFSRAKRLLICVGDHETVAVHENNPIINSLAEFYNLCKKEGYLE